MLSLDDSALAWTTGSRIVVRDHFEQRLFHANRASLQTLEKSGPLLVMNNAVRYCSLYSIFRCYSLLLLSQLRRPHRTRNQKYLFEWRSAPMLLYATVCYAMLVMLGGPRIGRQASCLADADADADA